MDGLVVKEDAGRIFSMRAKTLSMRRCNYDQRIVVERLAPQKSDQLPDCGVRGHNRAIVRRTVRGAWILQIDPNKERPLFVAVQPTHGVRNHLLPVSPRGLETPFTSLRLLPADIVHIQASVVALVKANPRIHQRRS